MEWTIYTEHNTVCLFDRRMSIGGRRRWADERILSTCLTLSLLFMNN